MIFRHYGKWKMTLLFTIVFILFSLASSLYAHEGDLGHYVARAHPLGEISPPNIDGILTDAAWQKASPVSRFVWKDTPDKAASEETIVYIVLRSTSFVRWIQMLRFRAS